MAYKNTRNSWKSVVRVLAQHVDSRCGYQRLVLAVIGQTLSDLCHPDPRQREQAARSVRQGCLAWWCSQLDLEHDFLLRLIDDADLVPGGSRTLVPLVPGAPSVVSLRAC